MRFLSVIATIVGLAVWAGLAAAQPVTVRMWMHEHPPRIADRQGDHRRIREGQSGHQGPVRGDPGRGILHQAADRVRRRRRTRPVQPIPRPWSRSISPPRILAPIDYAAMGYADEAALLAKFQGGFDGIRFHGKLYGVPTEVINWACYANNAHVEGGRARPGEGLAEDLGRRCPPSPRS